MTDSNEINDFKVEIEVPFPTDRLAQIAYQVLKVDPEPKRSQTEKNFIVNNNKLKVVFIGKSFRSVRVSVTAFFENIALICETFEFAGDPVSDNYKYNV